MGTSLFALSAIIERRRENPLLQRGDERRPVS